MIAALLRSGSPTALVGLLGALAALSPSPATAAETVAGLDYHTVTPCRVFDSRSGARLQHGTAAAVQITSVAPCNLPPIATAVALNLTVVSPTRAGEIVLFEAGGPAPEGRHLFFAAGQVRAGNAIALLSADGKVAALGMAPPDGTYHLILDVT